MDFIVLICCALILTLCLFTYLAVKKGLQSNTASLEAKLIYDKILEQERTISDLKVTVSQLLASETTKLQEVLNNYFSKSQEQGFKTQTQVQESLQRLLESSQRQLSEGVKMLSETTSQQLQNLSRTNNERLTHIQESVEKRMDENQRKYLENFAKTKEDLVKMQEAAAQMREVSNESKNSIEKLNTIFGKGAAKSYGTFGEQMLEQVLQDTIPGSYQAQFTVPKTNEIIDFCITLADETIGIDAKFPLDTYDSYRTALPEQQKELRKVFATSIKSMCDSIAKKYVASKFFKQVYIYFPSDSIYLEVVNDPELSKLMRTKAIYPASPSTILPLIAVVAQYNKRVKVQDDVEMILKGLEHVDKYLNAFMKQYELVGEKLRHAQDRYNDSEKQLGYLGKTVTGLTTHNTLQLENKNEE